MTIEIMHESCMGSIITTADLNKAWFPPAPSRLDGSWIHLGPAGTVTLHSKLEKSTQLPGGTF